MTRGDGSAGATAHDRLQRDITLVALGEPIDGDLAAHVQTCERCRSDLVAYRRTIEIARAGAPVPDLDESGRARLERLWGAVAVATSGEPVPPASEPTSAPRGRRWAVGWIAAAVVAVAAAGVGGWALGHSGSTQVPVAGHAALTARPGTPGAAHGVVSMRPAGAGYEMTVRTTALPAWSGYYEVWLYDPSIARMVAIGTLGPDGSGSFTMPAGIDVRAYRIVDVSAQRYDGDAAHQRSVLRGAIVS